MNTNTAMAGWGEDDVLDLHGELEESDFSQDEDDESDSNEDAPTGAEEETPTTESESETAANDEDGSTAPTTESTEQPASNKLRFKAKVDHDEMDVEIDPSDLPTLFQKAHNHERMSKRRDEVDARLSAIDGMAKALGYESIDAMLKSASDTARTRQVEELIEGGTAKEIAEFYVDNKMSAGKNPAPKAEEPKTEENEFAAQVAELYRARPDLKDNLKSLPDEVTKDVLDGKKTLLVAYTEWESKKIQAENQRLKNERNAFQHQADAASRSPVRGTTTTGTPSQGKTDPLLAGFGDLYD